MKAQDHILMYDDKNICIDNEIKEDFQLLKENTFYIKRKTISTVAFSYFKYHLMQKLNDTSVLVYDDIKVYDDISSIMNDICYIEIAYDRKTKTVYYVDGKNKRFYDISENQNYDLIYHKVLNEM